MTITSARPIGADGPPVRSTGPRRSGVPFDDPTSSRFSEVTKALRAGRPALILGTTRGEPEGQLLLAASKASPAWIAFMVRYTSGVLCIALEGAACDRLNLPQMVRHNENAMQKAFTVSVDAKLGISTGISAADRATTIGLLADADTDPGDLTRPGHVFPLRARTGGVLERPRFTETAVDLTGLAGESRAGVIAALVNDGCAPITQRDLGNFASRHQVPTVTIDQVVAFRRAEAQSWDRSEFPMTGS